MGTIAVVLIAGAAAPAPAAATAAGAMAAAAASNHNKWIGTGFAVGAVGALWSTQSFHQEEAASGATLETIERAFSGAVTNNDLISKVARALKKYNYGKDSLVATSLAPDEVNRGLEAAFGRLYGSGQDAEFNMGGLAAFPFGGATSFGAMASHIPDQGSALIVFGPHVGVDSQGRVGSVDRRGRSDCVECCASAIRAMEYVTSVQRNETRARPAGLPPDSPLDAQQTYVQDMLLPYAARLEGVSDRKVELPFCLYDAQKKMMTDIVTTSTATSAAGSVMASNANIAVLGGIQINTPPGITDYYLPLSFEVYNNKGKKVEDLTL